MKLRGREELPALRPDALVFESCLHSLQAAVISQEGIEDLRHVASPVRIHLDGAVLLPIHNNMLPDVTNRRIAASPVSLFSKAQHIIRNTGRDGFTFHLSKDHRDIHHGAPDRRRGIDIFLYGNKHHAMLLQERVDIRKVPDVPGKTIQLIDYQDIAEATLYKRQHTLQIRPGRIRTSEVFIRELLPGIHLAGKLRLAVFPVHPELIID